MGNVAMKGFTDLVVKSLDEIDGKTLPWVRPWRTMDSNYRNAFSGHKYKGVHNILVCLLQNRTDPRYLTFNQIRKAKAKLKKGSKATHLIAWKISQKMVENKDTGKMENKKIIFAKDHCVFNVEDVDGLNLKPIDKNILDESVKPNKIVENLFKKFNVKVNNKMSNRACYDPLTDEIDLPLASQFTNSNDWSGTCLHELVHWTAKRVDRDCSKYSFDVEERAMEELVAELGSMFLCMTLKIDGYMDVNNLAYLKSWKGATTGKNGERFIYKACSLAEKACKFLIGDLLVEKSEEPDVVLEAAE